MLALTPAPLQTAGERALFGELTRWDTGGSVRAAVVASIPLVDGPLERRMSDAVLFVPEGLAVVRVVEVRHQSGVVTALPEGAWTIAQEGGPSSVLQLSGGGSTTLDGLMRAGMDTAMKLRRAGLEPGRIARLTVLVGDVTGLDPADGDLGEGDQVAILEPRSLLLGIARCSRYSGVDNPRLWTTADVRAALEALGLQGRGPTVEELNGEGFPYSPYVLRRPELLAPAAMAASSDTQSALVPPAARPQEPQAVPEAPAPTPVREQPSPAVIAQAVAASAAAGHAAAAAAPSSAPPASPPPAPSATPPPPTPAASATPAPPPVAPSPRRDTVAIDAPSAPADDTGGIGGLFAGGEPDAPQAAPGPPRTAVFPAAVPTPAAPPATQPPARFSYWTDESAPVDGAEEDDEEKGSRGRMVLVILAGLVVLAALVIAGWMVLGERGDDDGDGASGPSAAQPTVAGPAAGDVQTVGGIEYTVEAVQVDKTCVGHAYGDTAAFFDETDCTGLSRAIYSGQIDGEPVVLSVVRVQMADPAAARSLRDLTDRNGSGNVSDLLREGVRYPGSPADLSGAEYASAVSGPTVTVVESAWVDADAEGSSAVIDQAADDGLALPVPPFATE